MIYYKGKNDDIAEILSLIPAKDVETDVNHCWQY